MSDGVERGGEDPAFVLLEGGTDAASMLIFDPAALPDDYDARAREDPTALIEPLAAAGRLSWLDTAADGGYSLGLCVDRPLPPDMVPFAKLAGESGRFSAPSGRLYFTGIEYAFRHDDSFLRKYPHMGAYREIPPGEYHLRVFEMTYPEEFHEDLLRASLPPGAFRVYSLMNSLIPLGCVAVLALVASPFWLGLRLWCTTVLPLALMLVLPAIALSRTRTYREAKRLDQDIRRQYPDYMATLDHAGDRSVAARSSEPVPLARIAGTGTVTRVRSGGCLAY
jgi:hypothetical protein